MGEEKDKLLYVTGMDLGVNKQNTEGCEMVNKNIGYTTVEGSILHEKGIDYPVYTYRENGVEIAKGEGVMCVVEDYLVNILGYDLTDIDNDYVWKDYPSNTNYEVCELGIVRNKRTLRLLHPSLSGRYGENNKDIWRVRMTISGEKTGRLSQVVAKAFLGEKPEDYIDEDGEKVKYVVGHKNDIPFDNRADNLEYITEYENKTVDWVLREIARKGLTVSYVDAVYKQICEVVEDKYGVDVKEVGELNVKDIEEVMGYITVTKRTVVDIYNYKVYGTGTLARLETEGDKYIL